MYKRQEEYYPFSNNEKEMMKDIRKVMTLNNYDPMTYIIMVYM